MEMHCNVGDDVNRNALWLSPYALLLIYVLPVYGSDVILGVQWLKTFGKIMWDFANLTMSFTC